MSANATNSSTRGKGCTLPAREEILEDYLSARLSEENRDAFEEHYFGCAHCFDELQTLQAVRDELPRAVAKFEGNPTRLVAGGVGAAAVAAALVLAVGAGMWMRPAPLEVSETSDFQLPSSPTQPESPQPPAPEPAIPSGPSLEQLARFEPPGYEPLRFRGIPDDATARFQRGIERYRRGDYGGAVDNLRVAAELDPDAAHICFFLGVSHLMLDQENAGIMRLRATIALGDSPYLEEAHFYLAKAFLRRQNVRAAETQLKTLIELRGSWSDEARRLLTDLQKLNNRSD